MPGVGFGSDKCIVRDISVVCFLYKATQTNEYSHAFAASISVFLYFVLHIHYITELFVKHAGVFHALLRVTCSAPSVRKRRV